MCDKEKKQIQKQKIEEILLNSVGRHPEERHLKMCEIFGLATPQMRYRVWYINRMIAKGEIIADYMGYILP